MVKTALTDSFLVKRYINRSFWCLHPCPYLSPVKPQGVRLTQLLGFICLLRSIGVASEYRILWQISLCISSDSDSAPLPECCEGHPAGGPLPGELLLSGGGAPQQAGGGGPVCLYLHWILFFPSLSFLLCISPALKLSEDHLQLSHKCGLVLTCVRKYGRARKHKTWHKHGQGSECGWERFVVTGAVRSCCSSPWWSAVTRRKRFSSRAPSTPSESASPSSRSLKRFQLLIRVF